MRILITSGGTREPIDGVRFITNFSSGSTGAFLTDYFRNRGHQVTLMRARDSKKSDLPGESIEFVSFLDLEEHLKATLANTKYDVVIHLAAISDYSVDSISVDGVSIKPNSAAKISSEAETVTLTLKRNKKLIHRLKEFATNKNFILIGFKLTNTETESERLSAVKKLGQSYDIDFIVHNDLSEITADGSHLATIYQGEQIIAKARNKTELAQELEQVIAKEVL